MEIYDNDEGDDDSDGGIEVDDENDEETMLPGKEESSSGMLKTFSWKYNPGNIFMHRCIDKTERFPSVCKA